MVVLSKKQLIAASAYLLHLNCSQSRVRIPTALPTSHHSQVEMSPSISVGDILPQGNFKYIPYSKELDEVVRNSQVLVVSTSQITYRPPAEPVSPLDGDQSNLFDIKL